MYFFKKIKKKTEKRVVIVQYVIFTHSYTVLYLQDMSCFTALTNRFCKFYIMRNYEIETHRFQHRKQILGCIFFIAPLSRGGEPYT